MRLLIVTQKIDINDDILGFFHRWVIEFAKHCEKVTVICLEKGEYSLPENARVLSLGKEAGNFQSIFKKFKYLVRFYKYIWREKNNYDKVFVHMNPEYVVLGGLIWKFLRKDIFLWYTHKSVNFWLRLAEKLADRIFTASRESFRLPSKKVLVTGHGIDINVFRDYGLRTKNGKFTILTAGRISESKNIHLLIEAGEILNKKGFDFEMKIAGGAVLEKDKIYFEKIKEIIEKKKLTDKIQFAGSIPNKDIHEFYKEGDLFLNLSKTGSLDKAVLEAMASGLLVLTSNEAFKKVLSDKYFVGNDPLRIAEKIIILSKAEPDPGLKEYVLEHHDLKKLIGKILAKM